MKIPKGKLIYDSSSSDEKRAFIKHENEEFRLEVDTDDCDLRCTKAMIKELIRRWNSFEN